MIEIRYVKLEDKDFWYSLDKHLPEVEFEKKVRDKRGYVLRAIRGSQRPIWAVLPKENIKKV